MTRIYHPWFKWEDYHHNFYGTHSDYVKNTDEVYACLLKDLAQFEAALQVIVNEWTYACEHNLTNEAMNRIAYLGQAACALVHKAPSQVSRNGYNLLTDEEKKAADAMANKYLNLWLETYKNVSIEKISG